MVVNLMNCNENHQFSLRKSFKGDLEYIQIFNCLSRFSYTKKNKQKEDLKKQKNREKKQRERKNKEREKTEERGRDDRFVFFF